MLSYDITRALRVIRFKVIFRCTLSFYGLIKRSGFNSKKLLFSSGIMADSAGDSGNKFINDGSFMELFKKRLEQQATDKSEGAGGEEKAAPTRHEPSEKRPADSPPVERRAQEKEKDSGGERIERGAATATAADASKPKPYQVVQTPPAYVPASHACTLCTCMRLTSARVEVRVQKQPRYVPRRVRCTARACGTLPHGGSSRRREGAVPC